MKKVTQISCFKGFSFLLLHILNPFNVFGQEMSVMTYNIRLDLQTNKVNDWNARKEQLVSLIRFYEPDILGTQEVRPGQMDFLSTRLPEYQRIGLGREGNNKGEHSAIFYKKEVLSVIKSRTFWLSETPGMVSKGWDAAFLRICTYALFEYKSTDKRFYVFNTHLDNKGARAREEAVKLILKKITTENKRKYPVILMGDLNALPESSPILNLLKKMIDTKRISEEKPFGPSGTFNAFDICKPATKRIDYIFVSQNSGFKVKRHGTLNNSVNMKLPSDHYPVFVELIFK